MTITPSVFEAFLKCPTKCWLRFTGEPPTGNTYAEWVQAEQESYRADAAKQLIANAAADKCAVAPVPEDLKTAKWPLAIDVPVQVELRSSRRNGAQTSTAETEQSLRTSAATTVEAKCIIESRIHVVERVPSEGRGKAAQFIPIRFIFTNKLGKDDKLLLAFDAFVLSEILGREVSLGKIMHGDDAATLKVKTSPLTGEVRKRVGKITVSLSNPAPPELILNRHCAECEFQARCRKIAVEKDDLSLLAGMSAKERQKLRSKGTFTVTQLSYTFRPRRRPKRLRDKREKYHHSLKALAIREKKIHIVGSPELKIEGTPVYLDVEGLPDRDFYYLIGVRIGSGESAVQHSLWADSIEDEGKIWREFLGILETVEEPVLIHYGSYETTFLKRMCEQHGEPLQRSTEAEALPSAVNVLSYIFAQIYFAGLSNGLKDTAHTLGFKWAEQGFSGLNTIVSRCQWEKSHEAVFKDLITAYNVQDCEALSLVADTVRQLGVRVDAGNGTGVPSVVRADTDEFPKRSKWRTFTSPVEGLERVNATAHWDYHRHRVYVRTGKPPRKREDPHRETRRQKRVQLVIAWPVSRCCPKRKRMVRLKGPQRSITVHDILFGRHSMKRRVVTYEFQTYRCWKCRIGFGVEERFNLFRQYGWNLVSYLCYQVIELNINQATVLRSFNRLFGFDLSKNTLNNMKVKAARYYAQTKQKILEHIVQGNLAHADETRANIHGKTGFVWVLTSHNEVVYMLADSREGEMAQKLLAGFKGVLVSDFYTAYDSIGCSQQRCLIHLIRDLNDEVLNNPFDTGLKQLVTLFAELLKRIVETVDRHGLKRHFLKRHLANVDHFYREIDKTECRSEATTKCKERFERNRDKLFTFLNYDGVPWHNNNAEHAIKAFARLRDVIAGGSTAKGLEEYLTLLSLSQTCEYMGVDFLDFLRSGEKDIHAFAESRGGHRRRPQASQPTGPANANSDSGETVAS